jgi:hypothetical protein
LDVRPGLILTPGIFTPTRKPIVELDREKASAIGVAGMTLYQQRSGKVMRLHPRSQAPALPVSRAMSIHPLIASSPAVPEAAMPPMTLRRFASGRVTQNRLLPG